MEGEREKERERERERKRERERERERENKKERERKIKEIEETSNAEQGSKFLLRYVSNIKWYLQYTNMQKKLRFHIIMKCKNNPIKMKSHLNSSA